MICWWADGEIIIFNKNHSVNEREEVEGYLAQKWGLTGSLTQWSQFLN